MTNVTIHVYLQHIIYYFVSFYGFSHLKNVIKNIVIHHHATSQTKAEKHGSCGRAISSLSKAKPRTVDLVDIFGFQLRLLPSLDFLGLIMSLPEASL